MNEVKFNKWKEDNHPFFKALKDHKDQLDRDIAAAAVDVLICTPEVLESNRLYAAGLGGAVTAYEELSEMNFSFYQDLMGAEE